MNKAETGCFYARDHRIPDHLFVDALHIYNVPGVLPGSAAENANMTAALTRNEYLVTFVKPMRRLEADETYKPVRIREYVDECISAFDPPVTRDQLQIQHVYLNGDRSFCHVLTNCSWRIAFCCMSGGDLNARVTFPCAIGSFRPVQATVRRQPGRACHDLA